jgi:ethanolamine utilization protein EutN
MELARVIGTVVSTRKDDAFVGFKLMVIEVEGLGNPSEGERLVAIDTVGAGVGERVLVTRGGAARSTLPITVPTDAAIVGIIDTVDLMK